MPSDVKGPKVTIDWEGSNRRPTAAETLLVYELFDQVMLDPTKSGVSPSSFWRIISDNAEKPPMTAQGEAPATIEVSIYLSHPITRVDPPFPDHAFAAIAGTAEWQRMVRNEQGVPLVQEQMGILQQSLCAALDKPISFHVQNGNTDTDSPEMNKWPVTQSEYAAYCYVKTELPIRAARLLEPTAKTGAMLQAMDRISRAGASDDATVEDSLASAHHSLTFSTADEKTKEDFSHSVEIITLAGQSFQKLIAENRSMEPEEHKGFADALAEHLPNITKAIEVLRDEKDDGAAKILETLEQNMNAVIQSHAAGQEKHPPGF